MGSLHLNSISTVLREPTTVSLVKLDHQLGSNSNGLFLNMKKNNKNKKLVCCHNKAGKVFGINGSPTVLTERVALEETEDLMGFSPNGTSKLVEHHEGLGIVRFFKGKVLLITGASGFLGKVLIEKILRTAPDVGKIYVLMKAKNKEAAMDRLMSEIIHSELFRCLQEVHGGDYQAFMLSKLVPVVGNLRETQLGIQEDLADEISQQVNIIVNSAANTTFDERYDEALDTNTIGPRRLMNFAKRCKKLIVFMHVSTAYVNGQRQGRVVEKAFSLGDSIAREKIDSDSSINSVPLLDVEAEIKLAFETASSCENSSLAQELKELGLKRARVHGWQDTYVFTKAMGEMVINSMRGDIPVVTIRPSVIESTCREPFPGWMEGNRMMDPIVLYYGKGQLTGFLADPNGVLDVVPADMVVNATLAAMAKHGSGRNSGTMNIYHIASSVTNPLIFKDLSEHLYEHFNSSPYMDSKGRPIHVHAMKLFHNMDDFTSHVWNDTIQRSERLSSSSTGHEKLTQKLKSICLKSLEQAKYLAGLYEPYTFYGGRFDNTNTQKLMEEMSEEEKVNFGFDVGSIEWKDYISSIHIPGLRRYVMKGRGMCNDSKLLTRSI